MKRFLAFLLCLLMLFSLCACTGAGDKKPEKTEAPTPSPSEEPEEAECTPLMYKVTDGKGGVLYILGSIHVADDRAKDMPDYVTDAYDESDYLCVECDTFAFNSDMAAQRELAELVVYSDGSKISDHISAETYEAAKAIKADVTNSVVDGSVRQYAWYKAEGEYGVQTVVQVVNTCCLGYEDIYGKK